MFCKNCGAQVPDGSLFCDSCGARVEAAPQAPEKKGLNLPGPLKNLKVDKKKLPLILGIAGAAFLCVLVLIIVLSATAPQRRARAYVTEMLKMSYKGNANANKLIDLCSTDKMLKGIGKKSDRTVSEMKKDIRETIKDSNEHARSYYGDKKVSYKVKVKDVDKMDKDILKSYKTAVKSACGSKVTAGKTVEIEITVKIDGEENTYTRKVEMLKIDGKWIAISDLI